MAGNDKGRVSVDADDDDDDDDGEEGLCGSLRSRMHSVIVG